MTQDYIMMNKMELLQLLEDASVAVLHCLNAAQTATYPDEAGVVYWKDVYERLLEAMPGI